MIFITVDHHKLDAIPGAYAIRISYPKIEHLALFRRHLCEDPFTLTPLFNNHWPRIHLDNVGANRGSAGLEYHIPALLEPTLRRRRRYRRSHRGHPHRFTDYCADAKNHSMHKKWLATLALKLDLCQIVSKRH